MIDSWGGLTTAPFLQGFNMDYKRKYEIQMKINKDLESQIERLKNENAELLKEISDNKTKMEMVKEHESQLKSEIDDAKKLRDELTKSVAEMRSMKKEYRGKLKSFLGFIKFNSIAIKLKGY